MRELHVIMVLSLALFVGCTATAPRKYGTEQLNQQGVQYLTNNDLPKAHEKFIEAWKIEPQNADTLYNLASTYHRKGQNADAEKYYLQALKINPKLEECRHNYYLLLVSENRTAEARGEAEKWLAQNKKSADAYTEVGWLMRMEGNLPEAQKNLEQALTLEPHNTEALLEMGKTYQDLHMNERARGLYIRVLQQDLNNREAKAQLTSLPKN